MLIAAGCWHAVLQEKLGHQLMKKLLFTITSSEFGACSGLSLLYLLATGRPTDVGYVGFMPNDVPVRKLLQISCLVLSSLVSGNLALRWVSYPVKVVAKSCKLLPTMALGTLFLRKRYSAKDCLAAMLLCAGLVGFTLFDSGGASGKPSDKASSPFGVAMLLFAVSCDAVQVLLSERMLRAAPHLTPMHVMLYTNGFAFLAVLSSIFVTGEYKALAEVEVPWGTLFMYGASSFVSVCCFITLTRTWGGTAAVIATNSRKLLTVVLSFILFPKPFNAGFGLSGLAVVAGVLVHRKAGKKPAAPASAPKGKAM